MIKFYQGTYSELSAANRLSSKNNICFVTDRKVLIMGGNEYGKDSAGLKISSNSGFVASGNDFVVRSTNPSDFPAEGCDAGTLFFFKGDQSILQYNGGTAWSVVQNPELKSADLLSTTPLDAEGHTVFSVRGNSDDYQATTSDVALSHTTLETKVADAYENDATTIAHDTTQPNKLSANHIVVSKQNGIGKTDYVLDNGQISAEVLSKASAAVDKDASLDTTLVNGRTAAKIVEEISKNKTTLTTSVGNGAGFITWASGQSIADGTLWTPTFNVTTGGVNALQNNAGDLELSITLKKLTADDIAYGYDAGYRSQYALINTANNQSVQIGDTINLVKDQFLKGASYTPAKYQDGIWYNYYIPSGAEDTRTEGWYGTNAAGELTGTVVTTQNLPDKNAADRYLKLVFTLTKPETEGGVNDDNDSVTYINVNELFDSLSGVNGVRVDQSTNIIYGVVDTNSELGMAAGNGGATKGVHFGATSYLTVGQGTTQIQDFKLDGIKKDISASIEDLDAGLTAGTNRWITSVGVNNGRLTADYASAYTAGINFNGVTGNSTLLTGSGAEALNMPSGTWKTANDAISALALHIGNLDYSYTGKNAGVTKFIYAIEQVDGAISVSGEEVDASDLVAHSKTSTKLSAVTLTSDNVNATRTVTGKAVPVYAITSAADGTSGSLQSAIDTIVTSVANTFADLNMTLVGRVAGDGDVNGTASKVVPSAATGLDRYEPYKVINAIEQKNGYVTAIDLDLVAQTVGFEGIAGDSTHVPVSGYTVGAALSSLSQSLCTMIDALDYVDDSTGAKPAFNVEANKYSIDNRVDQTNGKISTTKITLTDDNVFVNGINGYLPGTGSAAGLTGVLPASGRVAINAREDYDNSELSTVGGTGKCGSLQMALINISNIIADYCSFHAADGNII